MSRLTIGIFALAMSASILMACAHAFPDNVKNRAEKDISFTTVIQDPARFIGSVFIWGGSVAGEIEAPQGKYIEVTEHPVTLNGKVETTRVTSGKFIVYLINSDYEKRLKPGAVISVAGLVIGSKSHYRDGRSYTCPVVEPLMIYFD